MHNICNTWCKVRKMVLVLQNGSSPIDVQKSILIYIPPQIYESIGHKKLHRLSFADF